MKHLLLLISAVLLPAFASAGNGTSLSGDYTNIDSRTLTVIASGASPLTGMLVRDAVERNWNLTPFEFCAGEEFDAFKTDTSRIFLMQVTDSFNGQDGPDAVCLVLLKGSLKAGDGFSHMPVLAKLVLCPVGDEEDAAMFIPLYVKAIQSLVKERASSTSRIPKLTRAVNDMAALAGRRVLVCEGDVSDEVDTDIFEASGEGRVILAGRKAVEEALAGNQDVVVARCFTVRGERKAVSYRILADVVSGRVFLYFGSTLMPNSKDGFSRFDIRRIISAADAGKR